MALFGDLDDDGAFAAELAAAADGLVGAFEGFDGEDHAVLDEEGLPDVEAADVACDLVAEGDVAGLALIRCAAGEHARAGDEVVHEAGGGEHAEADAFHLGGDASEDGVGVLDGDLAQPLAGEGVETGAEEGERVDLSGHEAAGGLLFGGPVENGADLADAEPRDGVGQRGGGAGGRAFEGDHRDVADTGLAGACRQTGGVGAAAC